MPISNQLLSKARSNVRQSQTVALTASQIRAAGSGPSTQELLTTIAALESRLAKLERALYVGDDGSVVLYATTNLILYAEQEADLHGNRKFSVSAPGNSLEGSNGIVLLDGSVFRVSASTVEMSSGAMTFNAGTVTASGVVKCDTIIANSVVGSSYTPGAGNVW